MLKYPSAAQKILITLQYDYIMQSTNFSITVSIQMCNFSMNAVLFRRFASALRRSSLYGVVSEKAQPLFADCALLGGNCSMSFFAKSLLLEMPQENLIRRLQGFVILAVSGAKPLHCRDEYIVIAALPLELL